MEFIFLHKNFHTSRFYLQGQAKGGVKRASALGAKFMCNRMVEQNYEINIHLLKKGAPKKVFRSGYDFNSARLWIKA